MIPADRDKQSYWAKIWRDWLSWDSWFTWNAWILRAYRDRIDYRSFLHDKTTEITEDLKDNILTTYRSAILNAIHQNKHENAQKKTVLHYIGKVAVQLLAISFGFVISFMVGAHLNVAGRAASELVAWLFFTTSYLAYSVIYGKSVPQLAEKLLYKDEGESNNWHFFEKQELEVYLEEGICKTGFLNDAKNGHDQNALSATFSAREKIVGVIFLGFVLVVATVSAALSITKAPAAMATMKSLAFMSILFSPIGYILAGATFVCTLGLLLNSVVKLLKKEDKLADFYKLFYWRSEEPNMTAQKYFTNLLTGIFLIGVLALVGFGMFGSSKVEGQDFMALAHSSRNMAGLIVVASCAMMGKMIFSVTAAVNAMRLAMRACVVAFDSIRNNFTSSSPKETELDIIAKNDRDDKPEPYQLTAVGVNALCQPAKTTQAPEPGDPSPFIDGSSDGLFMLWITALGASLRAVNAGVERIKPYEPKETNQGNKPA